MYISIEQFANKAGVSATIIGKRIKIGEIVAEVRRIGSKLTICIDTSKYNPKAHSRRKPGRPQKINKAA